MSTFDGNIKEFPDIQVDYFRSCATSRKPLACFLSHVHSDHLVGLETLRSPFVYCSAATRALVLRLEKYPNRVNFAQGILEARKRTYGHLQNILKPVPLETPTVIELSPGNKIQVTLFDANHCPGAVIFLFENEKHAALYTGDTRCEPWFVNALVRSPCLTEYITGVRVLDTVYLDTTFIDKNVSFPTKAEGLSELLWAVSQYPSDTIFHLRAWTFGYEDVWITLAKALNSSVHVDSYKMQLYRSLVGPMHLVPQAPALVGFLCGNSVHRGCLVTNEEEGTSTDSDEDVHVRIHSCDKAMEYCRTVRSTSVVWIQPVSRISDNNGVSCEAGSEGLSDVIIFPYSRHSSYSELCHLLSKLRPRDVWPCTVDRDKWFHSGEQLLQFYDAEFKSDPAGEIVTIRDLFGEFCSGDIFRYDKEVALAAKRCESEVVDSQATTEPEDAQDSQTSTISEFSREKRIQAYDAIIQNAAGGREWAPIGLMSTTDSHTNPDVELGCG